MALLLPHQPFSLLINKRRNVPQFASAAKPKPIRRPGFVPAISKSTVNDDPPAAAAAGEPAPDVPRSKKPISSGQGFGKPAPEKPDSGPASTNKKKQKAGRRERGPVIRRNPVERPAFLDKDGEVGKEQAQSESAFLLTWIGLGALILIEGIALAASGFLPEQWDNFFVKYLYPSFTPTVGLFVAGTIVYGVLKYLQNENAKISK